MKYLFLSFFYTIKSFGGEFNYSLLKDKTTVEFVALANPSLLSIKGQKARGSGLIKLLNGSLSGDVKVDLNDFDTDIDSRNEHMKEKYLETNKSGFNTSNLKLTAIPVNKDFPEKLKKLETQTFEGMLTLHGVEKKVKCQLIMNANSPVEISGTLSFNLKLTDFGIEIPSFAGITVSDEINVKSDYVAKMDQVKK